VGFILVIPVVYLPDTPPVLKSGSRPATEAPLPHFSEETSLGTSWLEVVPQSLGKTAFKTGIISLKATTAGLLQLRLLSLMSPIILEWSGYKGGALGFCSPEKGSRDQSAHKESIPGNLDYTL
jgi:hypothetical protein